MLGTAFHDVSKLLTTMEERKDSWLLTLIQGHSMTSKLLQSTEAGFATMETLRQNTVP